MSGRKKKLSDRLKRYNVLLIIALIVLMLLLGVLMIFQIFGNNDYYKVVSREDNIEKSKQNDNGDHETIGWVRVQGTNIDYPVYGILSKEFQYPVVSTSFTWSLNMDSDFHNTMIVYGHNIMNLGPYPKTHDESFDRMEELMGFVYPDVAEKNQYIQLSMNGENYLYKIFAAGFMDSYTLDAFPAGEFSDEIRTNYLDMIKESSIYDYDVDLNDEDKILSVVTCTRFLGGNTSNDFMITGRLVRVGEKVNQYEVHRNKNYDKVYDILKGAEGDESEENA